MNQAIGVDPSVSSAPATYQCTSCEGKGTYTKRIPNPYNVAEDTLQEITCEFCGGTGATPPTIPQFFNGIVTPSLQVLLHDVLSIIDASIPNKEQNKAVKNLLRNGFDKAWLDITRESYPDSNFQMGPGHALEPYQDKYKAIIGATKAQN